MFWGCRWATRTFNSLQRFSMGLRSGDWLSHSRTLKCFLRSHSGRCVWDHCHAERPSHVSSTMPLLMEGGFHSKSHDTCPIHSLLYTDQSSWSLCRKTAPKHDVSTPMLQSRYGVLWMKLSILSPPNTFLPKSYILVSSDHMTFSQSSSGSSKCSLANFRRAWTCTGLSRGTRLALQDLSPWRRSVLLMVAFVTLVPALCRSFTRSPRVVLGFLLTVLVIILTPRGEILRGAPDRGRLSVVLYVFHFLIIAPTVDFFTPSCLPIADSVFPAWCRSTILFLVSFDSSLVLAIVEFGV